MMSHDLPKDRYAVALAHSPEHPCGIMTAANLATSKRANFTNIRRDLYSTEQGLWANAMFNTPGVTIDRGISTFSNLQVGFSSNSLERHLLKLAGWAF